MSIPQPMLPTDVLNIVAEHLIADDAFRTCANLNMASHAVYGVTLKTLWTFLCWAREFDLAEHSAVEIEAMWKVYERSAGAKYIRYMVEPHITNPSGVFQRRPILSESLATKLKASIKVHSHRHGGPDVHLHLFDNHGFGTINMNLVQYALDLVRTSPWSKKVIALEIFLRSRPSAFPQPSGGLLDTEADTDTERNAGPERDLRYPRLLTSHMLPDPQAPARLRVIHAWIDSRIKFAGHDYHIFWTNILLLLLPYALVKAEKRDSIGMRATLGMDHLPPAVLLSFINAYESLCDADEIFTTFDIKLTSVPDPMNADQVAALRDLFEALENHFIHAAQTIPLALLGSFHASTAPRGGGRILVPGVQPDHDTRVSILADIRVDGAVGDLSTKFRYGIEGVEARVYHLGDVSEAESDGEAGTSSEAEG